MSARPLPPDLYAAMARGVLVLTPSVRAQRYLDREFDRRQRRHNSGAWQPARVLSWASWITAQWTDAVVAGQAFAVLLNDIQEQRIWRQVLERSDDLGLQDTTSIASLCSSAAGLLGGYDLNGEFRRQASHKLSDSGAFHLWYDDFEATCREQGFLPASHLETELALKLRSRAIKPEQEYLFYGFDSHSPARQAVIDALVEAGAQVRHMAASAVQTQSPVLVRCDDPQSELLACCTWVRTRLDEDPASRVAIVVPDLEEAKMDLERSLRATVAPWLQDTTERHETAPFEFSIGRPIDQLPMVSDAIRLLRWIATPLPYQEAGALLRSPFVSFASTPEEGAELEAWVLSDTRRVRPTTTLRGEITLRECERTLWPHSRTTAETLRVFTANAERVLGGRHTFAAFADRVRNLFTLAGWPGANLDTAEWQATQRWDSLLDKIASLDIFGERVAFQDWLDCLISEAHETVFAPENTAAPIQVMSVSEAIGTTCDHLWFLHADELSWPPRVESHPLLPRSLQRSLGIPGGNSAEDDAAARRRLSQLVAAAGSVRFSHAARSTEGELRTSPYVAELPGLKVEHQSASDAASGLFPLEEAPDTLALPPLPENAAGGVGVLTSQAQCGFRAFAERRLFTSELETIDAGLSAGERGEQVHAVLQEFWSKCKSYEELVEISKSRNSTGRTDRDDLLDQCISNILAHSRTDAWDEAYLQVQRQRLHRLVSEWLNVELQRTPFTVADLEYKVTSAALGPLRMNIRLDRVDRIDTPDGPAHILIDYKTGTAERNDWFGDRPDAPQLPAYALAAGIENVQGIAFARVRVGKQGMNFEEVVADRNLLGNVKRRRDKEPTFAERMEDWQRDLTLLAEAFHRGEAVVEPKDYLTTCKGCASRLLCRMDVSRLEPDDDLLEETEEETGA